MTRTAAPLLALLVVSVSAGAPEHRTRLPLRLNGFTTLMFDCERPGNSESIRSRLLAPPGDAFADARAKSGDRSEMIVFDAFGEVGAETGEALLNRVDHPTYPNRDHATRAGTALAAPLLPARLFCEYRYLDTYSDRFDSLWDRHLRVTGQRMAHDEKGLAYDIGCGYESLPDTPLRSWGSVVRYGHWGVTPYYFSPLYSEGVRLEETANLTAGRGEAHLRYAFDRHRHYYARTSGRSVLDHQWHLAWSAPARGTVLGSVSTSGDTRRRPAASITAALCDSTLDPLGFSMSATVFGDLATAASVGCGIRPLKRLLLEFDAGHYRHQPVREYTFVEEGRVVSYHTRPLDYRTIHGAAQYDDTLGYPLSVRFWLDCRDSPVWERITTTSTSTLIAQQTIEEGGHTTTGGVSMQYDVGVRWLRVGPWGVLRWTPEPGKEPMSLPGSAGLDVHLGGRPGDPLGLRIALEYRGAVSIRYLTGEGGVERWRAPSQSRASFSLAVPVIAPFFRDNLAIRVRIDGGPVILALPFDWWRRRREHPRGNRIGPSFSLRIDTRVMAGARSDGR